MSETERERVREARTEHEAVVVRLVAEAHAASRPLQRDAVVQDVLDYIDDLWHEANAPTSDEIDAAPTDTDEDELAQMHGGYLEYAMTKAANSHTEVGNEIYRLLRKHKTGLRAGRGEGERNVKEAAIVALKWFHRYGYERHGPKIDGKSVVALLEDALNIEQAGRCETPSGVGAWLDEIGESLRRGEGGGDGSR